MKDPGWHSGSPLEVLRRARASYSSVIRPFVDATFSPTAIEVAWREFALAADDDSTFDPKSPHVRAFMPWFQHLWTPDPYEPWIRRDPSVALMSATQALLEQSDARLDPLVRRYLRACSLSPFSFHEVLATDPGRGLRTRDLLTGKENHVAEVAASYTLERGEAIYAQLVSSDGVTLIEGVGAHAISYGRKLWLLDLCRSLIVDGLPWRQSPPTDDGRVSTAQLHDMERDLRRFYFALEESMAGRPRIPMRDMAGEAIDLDQWVRFDDDTWREVDYGAAPEEAPDEYGLDHVKRLRWMKHMALTTYYERWAGMELAELDGLRPIDAVCDPVGREKVKTLFAALERAAVCEDPRIDRGVLYGLRVRLGLEGPDTRGRVRDPR